MFCSCVQGVQPKITSIVSKMSSPIIGIDFGTTNACVCVIRSMGPEVVANDLGNRGKTLAPRSFSLSLSLSLSRICVGKKGVRGGKVFRWKYWYIDRAFLNSLDRRENSSPIQAFRTRIAFEFDRFGRVFSPRFCSKPSDKRP